MKLWYTKEWIENHLAYEKVINIHLHRDWLTLEDECTKRGELIEKLERVIRKTQEDLVMTNYPDVSILNLQESALSAVGEWRKEQK